MRIEVLLKLQELESRVTEAGRSIGNLSIPSAGYIIHDEERGSASQQGQQPTAGR